MRVLITGGTGFIGSRLAIRCLAEGHSVRVLGQENTAAESSNRRALHAAGVEVRLGSVVQRERLLDAVQSIDTVFHLAAAQHEMGVPDQHFRDVNVTGTANLLRASDEAGVSRLVHGSTIGVYGRTRGIVDETTPCQPDNIYGVTKLEGEREALAFRDRLAVVVIRIPEVYGPGDRRLLKLFRAVDGRMLVMIGNGRNLHHLVYVDDLLDGMLMAAASDEAVGDTFLLAGSSAVSTRDLVAAVSEALGREPPRVRLPLLPLSAVAAVMESTLRPLGIQPPLHRRRLDFFRKSFSISYDRAAQRLGYAPKVDLDTGVRRTAMWYREEGLL